MGDMISSFLEAAQAIFSQMRDIEGEYKDNVDSVATLYMNNFLVDQLKMPSHHVDLCGDKDILNNSLAASHDLHLQVLSSFVVLYFLEQIRNIFFIRKKNKL